jgi:PEP-CTERM motif
MWRRCGALSIRFMHSPRGDATPKTQSSLKDPMKLVKTLVAAAAVLAAAHAQAGMSLNQPLPPGAVIEDFDSFAGAVGSQSVLGGLGTLTGGIVYREADATLQGANNAVGYYLVGGLSAQPFSGTGNWLNIANGASATVSFAQGLSYIGFLWGSVDTYNAVKITDGGSVFEFKGGADVPKGNGNRFEEQYFGFTGSNITSLEFIATGTAFEIDRLSAVAAPVPEPETYALMLAGLAAVTFVARRRKPA